MKPFHRSILKTTLSALTGSLLAVSSSSAAIVSYSSDSTGVADLLLSFRAAPATAPATSQGSATSYVVNIGRASQFVTQTPGTTVVVNTGNILTDLNTTYGSWSTRGDVFWSVVGASSSVAPSLYVTQERINVGTQSLPFAVLDQSARIDVKGEILAFAANGFSGNLSTANNNNAILQPNGADASSYNYQVTVPATDFGGRSQWANIEGNFDNGGATGSVLDLYRLGTSTTYLGSFSITSDGVLSFTSVPEPSAALLGTAGALLFLSRRSRKATV